MHILINIYFWSCPSFNLPALKILWWCFSIFFSYGNWKMEMQKTSTIFCRKVLNLLSFSVCSEFLFEWVVFFFFSRKQRMCVHASEQFSAKRCESWFRCKSLKQCRTSVLLLLNSLYYTSHFIVWIDIYSLSQLLHQKIKSL